MPTTVTAVLGDSPREGFDALIDSKHKETKSSMIPSYELHEIHKLSE